MSTTPCALIAEDEPLLAQTLQRELLVLWPQLRIVAVVGDGLSAVQAARVHQPQVVFMDIRMPGLDGLQAAQTMAEEWPDEQALPRIVFVTAYDEYAVPAFEAAATDYVLKPVRTDRLARTVQRLQASLASSPSAEEALLAALRQLRNPEPAAHAPLQLLQAGVGTQLRMVPVEQVVLFEAADKYVRAVTREGEEVWLRTPLKELLRQLDPQLFWQIHRGTVVRAEAIACASRDPQGQWQVQLHGQNQLHKVSRVFAHRFKAM
jgi:DNA-binding LytR/AlgR family response regulator